MSKDKVIQNARDMIGTKWRHRGRTNKAVDCAGLLILAFNRAGIDVEVVQKYGRTPWKDGLDKALKNNFGEPLEKEYMQEGDIAVMVLDGQTEAGHLGLIARNKDTGELTLIHSYSLISVIEHRIDDVWYNRIKHIYRYKGF